MIYNITLDDIFYITIAVTGESKINIKPNTVFIYTVYKNKQ